MSELRRDYFTDKFVILPTNRYKEFPSEVQGAETMCALCPGNEHMTPKADLVLTQREGSLIKSSDSEAETVNDWCVRVFPNNRHPAITPSASQRYGDSPLYCEPAYGYEYILAATPKHDETFSRMDVEQWVIILATVQDKVRWLYSKKNVAYVAICINYGIEAGAIFSHPHMQLITLPKLPPKIEQEARKVDMSLKDMGVCPMCAVVNAEWGGPRQIITTDSHIAFTPWASTYSYEYWIFPRRHQTSFLKVTQKEIKDLALILRSTLGGLSRALNGPSYNLIFHTSSEKKTTKQIHWHIEVYPQVSRRSGLERGLGVYVNHVPPEEAAGLLGASSRRELAALIGIT